jgi:hypothetical protein
VGRSGTLLTINSAGDAAETGKTTMKTITLTALAAAVGLAFGTVAIAGDMSKAEHASAKAGIKDEYKAAKKACGSLKDNAKDICVAEAKGKESVAIAELTATYEPTREHRYAARLAKARADHAVAREKCDDQSGNAKDVCVKEADAAETAAKADARAQRKVAEAEKTAGATSAKAHDKASKKAVAAREEASGDKNEARYSVAKEKCEALAGDAKETCMKDAKAHYGKS